MISKQKGKRLLNKLVYFQSLSNRAVDFKIKAKNCKAQSIHGQKRICLRKKKKSTSGDASEGQI